METVDGQVRCVSSDVEEEARSEGDSRGTVSPLGRLRAGEAASLSGILERHWHGCVLYARSLLDRPDEDDVAQDLAQEAFVRLWEHRERWDPATPPRILLLRIVRNLVLNEARRLRIARRWVTRVASSQHRFNPTPDDVFMAEQARQRVRCAVAALPPRRREIFLLVRHQGLTYADVGEIMGISRQTVANQMSAALDTLRDALEPIL
jgi:RNA polymerase sigma-70 factor (ECF subfamily)